MKYKVLKEFIDVFGRYRQVGESYTAIPGIMKHPTPAELIDNGFIEEIKDEPWKPKEGEECWVIVIDDDSNGGVYPDKMHFRANDWQHPYEFGEIYQTEEECWKEIKWRKAFKVLRDDAKGFKPDWQNRDETKYGVYYDFVINKLCIQVRFDCVMGLIYFATNADAGESIKNHEKEWKIFLGVDDEN